MLLASMTAVQTPPVGLAMVKVACNRLLAIAFAVYCTFAFVCGVFASIRFPDGSFRRKLMFVSLAINWNVSVVLASEVTGKATRAILVTVPASDSNVCSGMVCWASPPIGFTEGIGV